MLCIFGLQDNLPSGLLSLSALRAFLAFRQLGSEVQPFLCFIVFVLYIL